MLFLVIILSLIAFIILMIIEEMVIFIETIRNQKIDIISYRYRYISKVFIGIPVKYPTSASLLYNIYSMLIGPIYKI